MPEDAAFTSRGVDRAHPSPSSGVNTKPAVPFDPAGVRSTGKIEHALGSGGRSHEPDAIEFTSERPRPRPPWTLARIRVQAAKVRGKTVATVERGEKEFALSPQHVGAGGRADWERRVLLQESTTPSVAAGHASAARRRPAVAVASTRTERVEPRPSWRAVFDDFVRLGELDDRALAPLDERANVLPHACRLPHR